MSNLGWLAFDETENQLVQQTLKSYMDTDARNELGLGQIRDSISDHLFPGTSVLHSRLRYMLFIPWLFKTLEKRVKNSRSDYNISKVQYEARKLEIKFITSLIKGTKLENGKNEKGIIGVNVGTDLKYLPSGIYWSALKSWGICNVPGSLSNLFQKMYWKVKGNIRDSFEIEVTSDKQDYIWCEGIPEAPEDLLETATFDLTKEEGEFFKARLEKEHPYSLITYLAKSNKYFKSRYVWQVKGINKLPKKFQQLIDHGKIFSVVMQGASILYNLELSRYSNDKEKTSTYSSQMDTWCDELTDLKIKNWNLDEFWNKISHEDHKIWTPAKTFVENWLELVIENPKKLKYKGSKAVQLIIDRESKLKKKNSRFCSESALSRWKGNSGIRKFDYRWTYARGHINDITKAIR